MSGVSAVQVPRDAIAVRDVKEGMHRAPAEPADDVASMAVLSSGQERGHWRRALHHTLGAVEVAGPCGRYPGAVRTFRLGHVKVATIEGGAMRLRRAQPPATGDDGLLVVMVMVSGAAVVEQDGRSVSLQPGDLVLYDTSRPVSLGFPDPFCVKLLVVPRRLIGLRDEQLRRILTTAIRPDTTVSSMAAGFLVHLVDAAANCPAPTAVPLASSAIDLLSLLLAEELGNLRQPTSANLDRLPAIKEFIERHINDPDLTPQTVAHANSISVRYLHKLFQADGDTPGQWIQRCRLQKCRGELAGLHATKRSIAGVARQWGFTSASHFSRAFRSLYGITPAEWRDTGVKALATRCPGP
ncbi:helix-turn-helix domain-containing protein [Actinacidiphila rubida]|uniref:AraC-type DNA-binding protein n=1 Tax=Actinacidiphila rubida TaxID=310780 RepID=A0A1H8K838_9ACTN|nr:helix-turn-helix domain-containing protein [Actinacidiphila rubida]SEN89025.1 AraC-type DNA-binding protein [Actinacidiphila rubida]